ncbi:sugar O-acetyltransferase [Reinekea forsetii]|nr:sugar O-acetyltransferase [Reinekea forsetii]
MRSGETFNPFDSELVAQRALIRQSVAQFNRAPSKGHLKHMFGLFERVGKRCFIEAGVHIDYGCHLSFGEQVYVNAHCVFLDVAPIVLSDHVLVGPGVKFCTVQHPLDAEQRKSGVEWAEPIHVGENAWIGAGAIILPGVTIAKNAVVGAGSVVTKDVAEGCVVKGNPAR